LIVEQRASRMQMDKAMKTFNNHLNPIFTQSGDVALDYVHKEQGRAMDLAVNGR